MNASASSRADTTHFCTQADADAWYAGGYTARHLTHAFLRWTMRSKHLPKADVPHRSTSNPAPISQHQRLTLLRQLVNHDDVPLQARVAAVRVLLYAQPLTRITRLAVDDVQHKDGEVLVRLSDPPSPVPAPFAGMLLDYLGRRPNTTTATNPHTRWLFPGRRPDSPWPRKLCNSASTTWASPPSKDAPQRSVTSSSEPRPR
ncbi:hypothetical protein ACIBBE_30790 [Streptomyces sp. NPDC051644]|uniref:hypothetical protein n=1 Tax=Streptomyces sp. NPDC051644 TaxID=3365666 RepID=UPI0037965C7B